MSLKIVQAEDTDVEILRQIGVQTYKEHFSEFWTKHGIAKYLQTQFHQKILQENLAKETCKYFLGYWLDKPIGFIKINLDKLLPNSTIETGLELEKIYLLKEFSGIGIGLKMLDFVLTQSLLYSQEKVWLTVLKTNERAKTFYERHGFITIDEEEFSTDKLKIDMWVMVKRKW